MCVDKSHLKERVGFTGRHVDVCGFDAALLLA